MNRLLNLAYDRLVVPMLLSLHGMSPVGNKNIR